MTSLYTTIHSTLLHYRTKRRGMTVSYRGIYKEAEMCGYAERLRNKVITDALRCHQKMLETEARLTSQGVSFKQQSFIRK